MEAAEERDGVVVRRITEEDRETEEKDKKKQQLSLGAEGSGSHETEKAVGCVVVYKKGHEPVRERKYEDMNVR